MTTPTSNPASLADALLELATFCADLQLSDIPADVVEHARLLVLDGFGCGMLGSTTRWAQDTQRAFAAAEQTVNPSAAVWGTSKRLGIISAAFTNAVAVHGYELDDVGAHQHNASVALTAAMAVGALAESSRRCGARLLSAFVAGCEAAARISAYLGRRPHVELGFHGPSVTGTFAATVAAGHLLGLAAEPMAHAIGYATQQTAGLMGVQYGGDGKRVLAGNAAANGVRAAMLARAGMTNTPEVLNTDYGGFRYAFTGGKPDVVEEPELALRSDLGATWHTLRSRVKMWACRSPIHAPIEGLRAIMDEHELAPADITSIRVGLDRGAHRAVGFDWQGTSVASAQMNLQYCLGAYLLERDVFVPQFREALLNDPALLHHAGKISSYLDENLPKAGFPNRKAKMHVSLADGRTFERLATTPGADGEPLPAGDVRAKFRKMLAVWGSDADARRIQATVDRLEAVDDLAELETLVAPR